MPCTNVVSTTPDLAWDANINDSNKETFNRLFIVFLIVYLLIICFGCKFTQNTKKARYTYNGKTYHIYRNEDNVIPIAIVYMDDSYNSRNGENILQIVFRESFFSNQAVFWLKWGKSWSFCNILNVNRLYP